MSERTYTRSLRLLLAIAGLAACRDRTDRTDRTDPAAEPPRGPSIVLSIVLSLDGAARTVSVERVLPLAAIAGAPAASWREVLAISTDDRRLELAAPSATYPGAEVRLYVERGRVAIGVFPPVTADMPPHVAALASQPLAALGNLARVEILTGGDAGQAPLPPLTIEVAGRAVTLPGDQVRALRTRSGDEARAEGWPLAEVIAAAAPGHASRRVRVIGASEVSLDGAELRDPEAIHVLKSNQRGEYVFRVWHKGGRNPTREVRRVTKLVID